jgi:hypothetical protein
MRSRSSTLVSMNRRLHEQQRIDDRDRDLVTQRSRADGVTEQKQPSHTEASLHRACGDHRGETLWVEVGSNGADGINVGAGHPPRTSLPPPRSNLSRSSFGASMRAKPSWSAPYSGPMTSRHPLVTSRRGSTPTRPPNSRHSARAPRVNQPQQQIVDGVFDAQLYENERFGQATETAET